ncbi:MAG: diguanylate cyclase [Sulfurovum sp.]|nr:diguanylate cyclase [Sulfurovum sp.]
MQELPILLIISMFYKKMLKILLEKIFKCENLLREVLFKVGQIFIGNRIHHLDFERDIKSLALHKDTNEDIKYFFMHTKKLISDIRAVEKIINSNKRLKLDESLDEIYKLLESEYTNHQNKEQWITLIFFAFAFLVSLVLMHSYFKILGHRKSMYALAYHDALTALPNRLQADMYMDRLLSQNKSPKTPFILLFIDLDRFKVINDTLGHDVGDEMLIILSRRIQNLLGESSFIARLGGDEFIAIIEKKRDIAKIEILVQTLVERIRNPMSIQEYSLNTTASIGIVKYPQDGQDKHTLLKYADSAMYHAKDLGKDTYAFYNTQLSIDMQRRLDLEQELIHALDKEEFTLCFQPQYDLNSRKILGVEALVRWKSELLGTVSPEEFISVAEDIGLIIELGYHIFSEACIAYMDWKSQGVDMGLITINISSIQFRQVDALMHFTNIIEETGINLMILRLNLPNVILWNIVQRN